MDLRVKDMDIATGGVIVALLNQEDALNLDLHHEDRVGLRKGRRQTVAVLDIAESEKVLKPGHIGLFEEAVDALKAKHNDIISLSIENKPKSIQYISKKLDKKGLSYKEIFTIIKDIVENKLTDSEATFFVSACYTNGLSQKEIVSLTRAMVETGETLKLKKRKVMGLHSIGGVPGNRTTMIVVPIIAASGLVIPKTSSRAITSPAGTADTMECLANVHINIKKLKRVLSKTNASMIWGGSLNLAPADDKIIRIEHPLSIDAEGQLLASVLAKTASVSTTHFLIEIPVGKKVKCIDKRHASYLKKRFETLGKNLGIKVKAISTDGNQPIGDGIGPILEAIDCIKVLKNERDAPKDLREKSLYMAGLMLEMGGKAKKGKGKELAKKVLESGQAYKKFRQIIKAQGEKRLKLRPGRYKFDLTSHKNGRIGDINNIFISKIARLAGAPKNKAAGIYLYKHLNDKVKKGEKILTVYAQNKHKLRYAKEFLKKNTPVKIRP